LGNARRLLGSLWEIPKGYRKAAEKRPNTCKQPIGEEGEFPSGYWQKHGNFHPFSLKGSGSVRIYLIVEGAVKIFKNDQRLFSYYCPFQPYHF
jgi:hypothetical protein